MAQAQAEVLTGDFTRCPRCPKTGGQVIASVPGQAPAYRAGHRAWELTQSTGDRHHDHYDPDLDAFVVVRD
jgi:hypothetical protein